MPHIAKPTLFQEAKLDGKDKMAYGQWLSAEVREHNPYWQAFYQPPESDEPNEESVPETPPDMLPIVPLLPQSNNDAVDPLPLPASHTAVQTQAVPATQAPCVNAAPHQLLIQSSRAMDGPITTALIPAFEK